MDTACTASELGATILMTLIIGSMIAVSAFTAWAIKEGEASRKRRADESSSKYAGVAASDTLD